LKVELDWLKKILALMLDQKRSAIEPAKRRISARRQCALLGLSYSSLHYRPQRDSSYSKRMIRLVDE